MAHGAETTTAAVKEDARMLHGVRYVVTATLPNVEVADAYVAWLASGHLQEVVAGGALNGEVIRLDAPADATPTSPRQVQSVYTFPSREAFAHYEAVHAPKLREDGRKRWIESGLGVTMTRSLGEVVLAFVSEA